MDVGISGRRPAVFLDRDGTLIEDVGNLADPGDLILYPETVPALRLLQGRFSLFIVTNQNAVGDGALTVAQVERVNAHLVDRLTGAGVRIEAVYACVHARAADCPCVKPKPHFPRLAAERFGLDLAASWAVGDHAWDPELAANFGGRGLFVLTGHGVKHRAEVDGRFPIAAHIGEAAEVILAEARPSEGRSV